MMPRKITEETLWDDYAEAYRAFDSKPTELNRQRVVKAFTDWAVIFSPVSARSSIALLRSRLPRP